MKNLKYLRRFNENLQNNIIDYTQFSEIEVPQISDEEIRQFKDKLTKKNIKASEERVKETLIIGDLKKTYKNTLIKIKEGVYVKFEDFAEIIRIEDNKLVARFIGGLYKIPVVDIEGKYIGRNLMGNDMISFK